MEKQDSTVRVILLGWLFVAFLSSGLAFPKDKKWPEPLPIFMDPGFKFSQVDTICLAPALDLRSDKSAELSLTEAGPATGFTSKSRIHSANQALAADFKASGYPTSECNPVNATLNDLRAPSDTWLGNLNFGKSNWLFVLGVEDVTSKANWLGGEGGHAIVSGFLFERQASSVRLVWRDRSLGLSEVGIFAGHKEEVNLLQNYVAVSNAIGQLISKFERRTRGRPTAFVVDYENFDTSCDQVWTALSDTLSQDSKNYKAAFLDASDKVALYTMHHLTNPIGHEDHVVLRTHGGGCVMELMQAHETINDGRTRDWDELTKRMRASLAK